MKKQINLYLIALLIVFSVSNSKAQELLDGPKISVNNTKSLKIFFGINDTTATRLKIENLLKSDNLGEAHFAAFKGFDLSGINRFASIEASTYREYASIFGAKAPQFVNEDLPISYRKRKFITDISQISYDLFLVPGNIVRFNSIDSSYQFKTLKAIIKGNKLPEVKTIADGMLYSAKINSEASFNASYLIAGVTVGQKEIVELNIQDVASSTVIDSLIDIKEIKRIIAGIPAADRKNYFYIKQVTLTTLDNKKFKETKFDASVNASFVTAGGKTYSSTEKFLRERMLSAFFISLDDLITN